MTESFGGRLRHERERRQIALQSIAEGTKISVALLEGLERDDVSRWPSGIFRKSFVRSYAQAIGLDPEPVVREFATLYPDPSEPPPAAIGAPIGVANGAPPAQPSRVALGRRRRFAVRLRRLERLLEAGPLVTLTIVSSGASFSRGTFVTDFLRRVAAAACDTGVSCLIALAFFGVLGSFWTPLSISMLCYYVGGILILGNTPGVCLFGPALGNAIPSDRAPRIADRAVRY